jgi:hypothetical protein
MPEGNRDLPDGTGENGDPTEQFAGDDERGEAPVSRRRLLQLSATGALSVAGVGAVVGGASDHPNTIVIDGTVSKGKSKYAFSVTGSVEPYPDGGQLEVKDNVSGSSVSGAVHRDKDAYRFSGELESLDVQGDADVSVTYGDDGGIAADRLEVVAESGSSVDYSVTASDRIVPVTDNGSNSTNDGDSVSENDDGSWTADGSTADGSGDTYDFWGDVTEFAPMDGPYTLLLNGSEVSAYELTGQSNTSELVIDTPSDGAVEYSFTTTGEITKVMDNGKLSAEEGNDDIVQNDDGTWTATGLCGNGYGDSYEFAGEVVSFQPEQGTFTLYLDGTEVTVAELVGDQQTNDSSEDDAGTTTHLLEIDTPSDGFVEYTYTTTGEITKVMDAGEMSAEEGNDDIVQNDDGTWTATGLCGNGYGDSYEFQGEATAFDPKEGSFTLYLDGTEVTPYELIGEEPPEDDTDDSTSGVGIRHGNYTGALGGGDGMQSSQVYASGDADTVVSSMSELQSAVDAASSGDVIYVQGSISGHLDVETPGVTIAGNRGFGSDGTWNDATLHQKAADLRLDGLQIDGGDGEFCQIYAPGLEVFNCLVQNIDSGDGAFHWEIGDTGATFSHCTFRDFDYYSLQVSYDWHSESQKITFQYCDFTEMGQHMIQGGFGWFHVRDNHFHGTLNHSTDHILEVRGGGGAPVPCGADAGNGIIEHNLNEANGSSGAKSGLVRVRGVPTDGVWVENNDSPGNSPSTGGCYENGTHGGWDDQLVMQNASGSDSFENVYITDNQI